MKTYIDYEEDLVKVAEVGDYESAYADYLNESDSDGSELTFEEFLYDMQSGQVRYCERGDGIYYINDFSL